MLLILLRIFTRKSGALGYGYAKIQILVDGLRKALHPQTQARGPSADGIARTGHEQQVESVHSLQKASQIQDRPARSPITNCSQALDRKDRQIYSGGCVQGAVPNSGIALLDG